jgi:hypothetical protein
MRWGYTIVLSVLYDDENRKPSSTPDLAASDSGVTDDLLLLG